MDDHHKTLSEQRTDEIIGKLLRFGVILAGVFVFIGGIFYLIRYGGLTPNYRVFSIEPVTLRTVSGVLRELISLHPLAIIQFGILILIATPVARVAFSVCVFIRQRDRIYIVITLVVLCTLLFSLAGGHL
jgi:uncharacterized membrane protein